MKDRRALAALLAVAAGFIPPAHAASPDEISEMRAQIKALRDDYEKRLDALERRLKEAEARAPAPAAPAPATAPGGAGLAAFNPAISVVLQGTYANLSHDPATWRIAGFAPGGEIGPPKRSFSLAESELNLTANVDDRFSGVFIASVTPEETIAAEEAYGLWRAGPGGTTPKFGRFFSGIGYLNEQHQHAWDFQDPPLAYQAFLGGQHRTDGVQVKWVAPTDLFVELSGEAGDGSAFPGNDRNKNGLGHGAAAIHLGGDVGDSHSWRAGLSYLRTGSTARAFAPEDLAPGFAGATFSGRSEIGIADLVWKWAPGGNGREVNAKVQGEYFRRREAGTATGFAADGSSIDAAYRSTQSGWYLQVAYQFMPRWRAGLRYDRLDAGSPGAPDLFAGTSFDPRRWAAMLDWSPSEFSRFRAQFQRSQVLPDRTDNELILQYILSLGAHGAHRY